MPVLTPHQHQQVRAEMARHRQGLAAIDDMAPSRKRHKTEAKRRYAEQRHVRALSHIFPGLTLAEAARLVDGPVRVSDQDAREAARGFSQRPGDSSGRTASRARHTTGG